MRLHILVEIKITPSPSLRQIVEFNLYWNNVIHRLFNCKQWELVLAVLLGLGRLNILHLFKMLFSYILAKTDASSSCTTWSFCKS